MKKIRIRIINKYTFQVNDKTVIKDSKGNWVKQKADYTEEELNVIRAQILQLDPDYREVIQA